MDAELLQRTNRLGAATSQFKRNRGDRISGRRRNRTRISGKGRRQRDYPGDNLPIVDWSKFNTERKEAHYIQINNTLRKLSGNKKRYEETTKKAEFEFMLTLKSLISTTAIDLAQTRVGASMRQEDRETNPDGYAPVFDKLSNRWGGRPICSSGGSPKKATRYSTFRSRGNHNQAGQNKEFLVAGI